MREEKGRLRPYQLRIWVDKDERDSIKKRQLEVGIKNFSAFGRAMLMTGEVVTVDYSELINLRKEINRIGTNINQIAKYVNSSEEVSSGQMLELQQELDEIKKMMTEIFDQELERAKVTRQKPEVGDLWS